MSGNSQSGKRAGIGIPKSGEQGKGGGWLYYQVVETTKEKTTENRNDSPTESGRFKPTVSLPFTVPNSLTGKQRKEFYVTGFALEI